jgi:Tfp pilus assembly protein PilF
MATALRNRGEYDAALEIVTDGLNAITGADSAHLWLEKGWVYSRQGQFADAISAFSAGLEAADTSSGSVVAHLRLQLARAEMLTGNTEAATIHAESSVEIFDHLDDRRGGATALRILGDVYRTSRRLDESAQALKRGLEIAKQTGNAEETAGCLINLGLVELDRGDIEAAIHCDQLAIEQFERIGIATGQAIGYGNLAEKLVAAGRSVEALENSARALDLARSIGDLETVADVTKTVAMARRIEGNLDEAMATAEEAATLYLELGATSFAREALELAAEVAQEAGDEERALSVTERARDLA